MLRMLFCRNYKSRCLCPFLRELLHFCKLCYGCRSIRTTKVDVYIHLCVCVYAQAYSNCEPLQPAPTAPETTISSSQAPPIVTPPGDLSYWQALVDPNTNHAYYWNSLTNEVSWTIPGGGVISLPLSTEVAVECEREMEEMIESYPYSTKLPAKFTKPGM